MPHDNSATPIIFVLCGSCLTCASPQILRLTEMRVRRICSLARFGTDTSQIHQAPQVAIVNHMTYGWLLVLSVSYWYCLPLVSTTVFGYTEFRLYDFLLAFGIAAVLLRHGRKLHLFFQRDRPARWLFRFCIWASVMAAISIGWNITKSLFVTGGVVVMDLFHLWSFVLAYGAFRVLLVTRTQCLRLLDVFLIV